MGLKMKRLEIIDGKFTLEGRVVEAQPIELKIICANHPLKTWISFNKPKEANAYVSGNNLATRTNSSIDGIWKMYCPILYLKIKE